MRRLLLMVLAVFLCSNSSIFLYSFERRILMEKLKNFFSNYKSDILNVLGVIALIAVVVVGAVLFFGRNDAEPDVVEDSTAVITTEEITTEPTTVEAETTTEAPETTTKAPVTTTKAPVTTTKAAVTTTKAPSNNKPSNTEEGTLPAELSDCSADSSYSYETKLASYNQDAKVVEAYEKIKRENIPPSIGKKGGLYWQVDGVLVTLCERCGKPGGSGTHGTCATFFHDTTCPMCGANVKGGTCHTCKY